MPRKKAAPSRTSDGERAAASWSLQDLQLPEAGAEPAGQEAAAHDGDGVSSESEDDYVTISSDDDVDFLPRKPAKARKIASDSASSTKKEEAVKRRASNAAAKKAAATAEKADRERHDAEYRRVASQLAEFDYYVQVRTGTDSAMTPQRCIKRLDLRLVTAEPELPSSELFWVYVSEAMCRSVVYYEWTGVRPGSQSRRQSVLGTKCLEAAVVDHDREVWRALSDGSGNVEVFLAEYCAVTGLLQLQVHLTEKAFVTLSAPSEVPRRGHAGFRRLMRLLFNIEDTEVDWQHSPAFDVDDVYRRLAEERRLAAAGGEVKGEGPDPQHPQLLPQLRLYQKEAVRWMLSREKPTKWEDPAPLHPMYIPLHLDGDTVYYSPVGGWLVKERPAAVPSPPGGILADEMGLGKTVEILSLVLNHHRPDVDALEAQETVDLAAFKRNIKRQEVEEKKAKQQAEREAKSAERRALMELKKSEQTFSESRVTRKRDRSYSFWEGSDNSGDDGGCDPDWAEKVSSGASWNPKYQSWGSGSSSKSSRSSRAESKRNDSAYESAPGKSPTLMGDDSGLDCKSSSAPIQDDPDADIIEIQDSSSVDLPMTKARPVPVTCNKKIRGRKKSRPPATVGLKLDPNDTVAASIEATIVRVCYDGKPPRNYLPGGGRKPPSRAATSSARRLTQLYYEQSLAATSPLRPPVAVPQPDADFSCLCGRWQERARYRLRCGRCATVQHAECVQYDVEDPLRGPYYCPQCWSLLPPVKSGATLIVSPSSISNQWVEEIAKHIRRQGMRVLVYTGVRSDRYLQPQTLAQQDMVVTTYTVLQRELNYTAVGRAQCSGDAGKRRAQRYLPPPTPLLCVDWWRVCLDEAQMVECVTTKTAEMALKLRCVNRWCVTGTPLSRSVQDLYGLLLFLGVEPVWAPLWWQQLIYHPYLAGDREPLHRLLRACLWRTAKADVLQQIGLPPQKERTLRLDFSPVESYFYRRQQDECSGAAIARLAALQVEGHVQLKDLEWKSVHQLLTPLLRLRQACCHPQVTRGQLMPLNKSTLTMEQLLQQLIKRATAEAEEAHRLRTAAINGMAALHILRCEWAAAAELYRTVLRQADELRDRLQTDSLQRLHALHNLAEMVEAGRPLPPTTRDDSLRHEADQLRVSYVGKHTALMAAALKAAGEATAEADDHAARLDVEQDQAWFVTVLSWCAEVGSPQDLMDRVSQQLRELSNKNLDKEKQAGGGVTKRTKALKGRTPENTMLERFHSLPGLQYLLLSRLTQLAELRALTQTAVSELRCRPVSELAAAAVDCHLRPSPAADAAAAAECQLCAAHAHFESYERQLFYMLEQRVSDADLEGIDGQINVRGELRRGNWGDNETERTLKTLLSAGRQLGVPQHVLQLGQHHVSLLDAQKKEFKLLRVLWTRLRDRVSAADELEMAVLRLRARYPDEPAPLPSQPAATHIIEPSAVDDHFARLKADRAAAESDLRRRLGQRLYLSNLRRSATEFKDGNPEPCPICETRLGSGWAVLQCGHCFCMQCIQLLVAECTRVVKRYPSIRCAVCRDTTRQMDIAYVSATNADDEDSDGGEIRVKGDHSTKVEAVVRCVLTVLREDPDAKTLVFATWTDALDVIAIALRENGVEVRCLHARGRAQRELSDFKNLPDVSVLLLPVHSGANGLNIIEATHVILVHPVLDPGEERQALGRVHRIGQLRSTTVHRLVVADTIEERILALNAGKQGGSVTGDAEARLTVADLRQLLVEDG